MSSSMEPLTLFAEGSRASPSASPESEKGSTTLGTSGRHLLTLLDRSGLHTPFSRMCRGLLQTETWHSTLFSLTWKHSATQQGRWLFRLAPSTRSTFASASGSWPTATSQMAKHGAPTDWERENRPAHADVQAATRQIPTPTADSVSDRTKRYAQGGMPLTAYVHQEPFPTPTRADGERESNTYMRGNPTLAGVARSWPTPRHEGFDAGGHRGTNDSLHSAVKAFPTPRHIYGEHPGMTDKRHLTGAALEGTHEFAANPPIDEDGLLYDAKGRKLSGAWTLALMGFPPDWCDDLPPDPLGTTPT